MTVIADFLLSLDVQTTVFLIGIAVLVQAGLIWFQSMMIQEYNGIRTAALGNFLYGSGILLTTFRGILPDVMAIVFANYLVIIGIAALYLAVCKFLGVRSKIWPIIFAMIPILVVFPYFTFVKNDFTIRVILMGIANAIEVGAITIQLFRLKRVNFSFSARFLAIVSAVYTIIIVLRTIGFWFIPVDGLFSPTPLVIIYTIGLFISSFLWSIGFVLMVSHRLQADLNELATVDSLTRISNRRAMVAILEAEFSRFSRTNMGFSVLLVDVDHFKTVNDRYGHEMGDIVLHDVAQLMKNSLRRQDFIARWGGEEFLILLPNTDQQGAMEIGERLRKLVEQSKFRCNGYQVSLTISIGVGDSTVCGDVNRIYKCSDVALYKAKLTRNAVALHELESV